MAEPVVRKTLAAIIASVAVETSASVTPSLTGEIDKIVFAPVIKWAYIKITCKERFSI